MRQRRHGENWVETHPMVTRGIIFAVIVTILISFIWLPTFGVMCTLLFLVGVCGLAIWAVADMLYEFVVGAARRFGR